MAHNQRPQVGMLRPGCCVLLAANLYAGRPWALSTAGVAFAVVCGGWPTAPYPVCAYPRPLPQPGAPTAQRAGGWLLHFGHRGQRVRRGLNIILHANCQCGLMQQQLHPGHRGRRVIGVATSLCTQMPVYQRHGLAGVSVLS